MLGGASAQGQAGVQGEGEGKDAAAKGSGLKDSGAKGSGLNGIAAAGSGLSRTKGDIERRLSKMVDKSTFGAGGVHELKVGGRPAASPCHAHFLARVDAPSKR